MPERKPAPPGWVRDHPHDLNLIRRKVVPTAAQAMFGHLPSAQQHSEREAQKYKEWLARKEKWR
jgi:hypothetical protein